jgi:hypothetical protein
VNNGAIYTGKHNEQLQDVLGSLWQSEMSEARVKWTFDKDEGEGECKQNFSGENSYQKPNLHFTRLHQDGSSMVLAQGYTQWQDLTSVISYSLI